MPIEKLAAPSPTSTPLGADDPSFESANPLAPGWQDALTSLPSFNPHPLPEAAPGSAVLQEALNLLKEMIHLTVRKMEEESATASLADHARVLSSISTAVGRLAYLVDIQARKSSSSDDFSAAVDQALAEINAAMAAEGEARAAQAGERALLTTGLRFPHSDATRG